MPGRIAVIGGTGEEGSGLALRWAVAGFDVVIGSRDGGRAETAAREIAQRAGGGRLAGLANPEAAQAADVIVVAVPYSGQADIYKSIADHIPDGAIVVDCTVPIAAGVGAKATHTLGVWEGSAAQQAQAFIPKGTKLVGAFHSLAAAALNDAGSKLEGDVLACGSKSGKAVVKELVEAIPDLRFVDAGPLDMARIIEPLTALLIGINHRYKTDRAGIKITGI